MNMKIYLTHIIIILLTLFSAYSFIPPSITAQLNAEIKIVNPATNYSNFTFYTDEDITSQRFNLTVHVYNVENLFAYQVLLLINDTQLNVTRAWLPQWDPSYVFYGYQEGIEWFPTTPKFRDDNNNGVNERLLLGATLLKGASMFNGDGLLATIELEIINAPSLGGKFESTLVIDNNDTYLLNEFLEFIPSIKYNGEYNYLRGETPKPWLEITPKTLKFGPFPPSVTGKTFEIQIFIMELSKQLQLVDVFFSLTFNSSLIKVHNVTTNPLWQQTTTNTTKTGKVQIKLEIPSSTPEGNVSLAIIEFLILEQPKYPTTYESSLTLNEISLTNPIEQIPTDPPINGTIIIEGLLSMPWLEIVPNIVEFGPEPFVGELFNITVEIRRLHSLWKLANLSISVTYNSTIVQLLEVTEGFFLPSFHKTYFNYTIGINHVNITQGYYQKVLSFPSGEGTIATLTFNITLRKLEILKFPFNLIEVTLLNADGNLIPVDPFKTTNGYCQLKGTLEISNLTLRISPEITKTGSNVTLSGSLTPVKPYVEIIIYYKLKEENTWKKLARVLTDELSQYQYVWTVNQIGVYQIKTRWQGDETSLSAESKVKTLIIEALKPSPPTPPLLIALAIAITLAAIIVATVLYLRKIKKQRQS